MECREPMVTWFDHWFIDHYVGERMRRKARTDDNQTAVADELRARGLSVDTRCAKIGGGFPDMVVGWRGLTVLVELKNPDQPPSKQRLTDDERAWIESWRGAAIVATDAEEIIRWFGLQQ